MGEWPSRNMYKGHMDKVKGGRFEVGGGMGGEREHGGVKMEMTVLEQQFKKRKKK